MSQTDWIIATSLIVALGIITLLYRRIAKRYKREVDDLSNKLEVSQERLIEAANSSIVGELASGIAHEINNPLLSIYGYSRMLARSCESEKIDHSRLKNISDSIGENISRITKVVKALENVSVDFETNQVIATGLDILIHDIEILNREKCKLKSIELRIDEAPEHKIKCYRELGQALINLTNNSIDAIKNLPDKWIQISFNSLPNEIEIIIRDSGKGINQEIASKMMDPFFTTKKAGEGIGMGLSIAASSLRKSGGKVEYLLNEENTTFKITIPIYESSES